MPIKTDVVARNILFCVLLSSCQQGDQNEPTMADLNAANLTANPELACYLDEINAATAAPETEIIRPDMPRLRGWLGFLNDNGSVPKNFDLVLFSKKQKYTFPATSGLPRKDVADANAKLGLQNAGYEIQLNLKDVIAGKYKVTIVAPFADQSLTCGTGKSITVK
jgi:hypothetical protein